MPEEQGLGRLSPVPTSTSIPPTLSCSPSILGFSPIKPPRLYRPPPAPPVCLPSTPSRGLFLPSWLQGSVSHTPMIRLSLAAAGGWLCRVAQL